MDAAFFVPLPKKVIEGIVAKGFFDLQTKASRRANTAKSSTPLVNPSKAELLIRPVICSCSMRVRVSSKSALPPPEVLSSCHGRC